MVWPSARSSSRCSSRRCSWSGSSGGGRGRSSKAPKRSRAPGGCRSWDTHGDKFPPYGGIVSGLKPLLPVFDHLYTTLINDLSERGLLDEVLVIAMGEFGRSPTMGTQGSPDGRNHWPQVMSVLLAGGGMRTGQVIGKTDRIAGEAINRPVPFQEVFATLYHNVGIDVEYTQLTDFNGRPHYLLDHHTPIPELI